MDALQQQDAGWRAGEGVETRVWALCEAAQ